MCLNFRFFSYLNKLTFQEGRGGPGQFGIFSFQHLAKDFAHAHRNCASGPALSNFLANIMRLNPTSYFELINADVIAKVENNTLLRKHSSCQPQAEIPVNWRDRAMTCPGLIQGQMQALYTFHGVLTVDAGIFFPKMRVICTFGV